MLNCTLGSCKGPKQFLGELLGEQWAKNKTEKVPGKGIKKIISVVLPWMCISLMSYSGLRKNPRMVNHHVLHPNQ